MTKHFCCLLVGVTLTLANVTVPAQDKAKPTKSAASAAKINFKESKLKNGRRVFLLEDKMAAR